MTVLLQAGRRGTEMKKLIGIELLKMTHYPAVWLVTLISVGQGVYYAFTDQYALAVARYPEAEYIIFIHSTARWFCMAAVFLTAYTIAGDFSMRTVLNVLAAGIDKSKYYFSRLIAQMLFFFGLYVCGNLFYTAGRILYTGKFNHSLSVKEFLLLVLVMGMQVCAYAAVSNFISLCCKKQALSILLGEVWIFLSIVMRIYAVGEDFYRDQGGYHMPGGPVAYEPMYVMECVEYYVSAFDSVFCFGFLKYALSAAVIISVAGIAGYICMIRSDIV